MSLRIVFLLLLLFIQSSLPEYTAQAAPLPKLEDLVITRLSEEFELNLFYLLGEGEFCMSAAEGAPPYLKPGRKLLARIHLEVQSAREAMAVKENPSLIEVQRQYYFFKRHWDPSAMMELRKFMLPHEFLNLPPPAPEVYRETQRKRVDRARPVLETALLIQDGSYVLGSRLAQQTGSISLLDAFELFVTRMREGSALASRENFKEKSIADAYRLAEGHKEEESVNFSTLVGFIDGYFQSLMKRGL